jgi:hypothetical protein
MNKYLYFLKIVVSLLLVTHSGSFSAQFRIPYIAEKGDTALQQRLSDLQSNLVVMSVALQPGFEDQGTLAYYRFSRGASIVSLFVTNGEALESDEQGSLPDELAAQRREESVSASLFLGGTAYFLNAEDVGKTGNRDELLRIWTKDSVVTGLVRAIRIYRPDIIILSQDWLTSASSTSARLQVLRQFLLEAVKQAASPQNVPSNSNNTTAVWHVQRVVESVSKTANAISLPISSFNPLWKKSYANIGKEAEALYQSQQVFLAQRKIETSAYKIIYPLQKQATKIKELDGGINKSGGRFVTIGRKIRHIAQLLHSGKKKSALKFFPPVIDSLDYILAFRETLHLTPREYRTILRWKQILEEVRCIVLAVNIRFTVSDSLLAARQVFFLKFDSSASRYDSIKTKIIFPQVNEGWIVSDEQRHSYPFQTLHEYSILTPKILRPTYPHALYGLQENVYPQSLILFVVHHDSVRERSFVWRKEVPLRFVPRFSIEVFTPIVFARDGEVFEFQLSNYTRDRVKGELYLQSDGVSSTKKKFALKTKDAVYRDTLQLTFSDTLAEGDHLVPLMISGEKVSNFVVRKFDVTIQPDITVGLLTGIKQSPVEQTLRRLDVKYILLDSVALSREDLTRFATIVVDRRASSLRPDVKRYWQQLDSYVSQGGHLLVLAQEQPSFNNLFMPEPFTLADTILADEQTAVTMNKNSSLFTTPNRIDSTTWDDWIYDRAYGIPTFKKQNSYEVLASSEEASLLPLTISRPHNQGRYTYVALALSPQLMNINPGAVRLFANLLSFHRTQ